MTSDSKTPLLNDEGCSRIDLEPFDRTQIICRAVAKGERVVRPKFGVDEDVCTGDHACMRLSGCPSLTVKELDDPLRDDPVAAIDQSCVGFGNCGEVADAAILCPSFYQADVASNLAAWRAGMRASRARSSHTCKTAARHGG